MADIAHDLNHALGRIPSGIFILTVSDPSGGRGTGMLASWVQQAGFSPPMLTVALGRDRFVRDWIRASGRFALNQVRAGDKSLVKHFGRGFAPDADAFEGLALFEPSASGAPPILGDALAYLVVEPRGEVDVAGTDHVVVLGEVVDGRLLSEGDPMTHIRKVGSHY
ncbi:MAG: flavin reductase family protein [Isosphaeraceae bacterium]|nr:flavin reductase family protein [Isosphaeraceae bacterium]